MSERDIQERVLSLSRRRGFYWPSFELYGGLAGFYDYGPLGLLMRENIYAVWKALYRREGFFEIDTPAINPEEVFVASGHVASFADMLVECKQCGESFRADQLPGMEQLTASEIRTALEEGKATCPVCGSTSFSEPRPFNLMFRTFIGPSESKKGYLRPETAQGIFINFNQLLRFYREKLPFGAIQRGRGFRNEISPRQGLIRLREFNMLEAELFVDPDNKGWPGFAKAASVKTRLLTADGKEIEITFGHALKSGLIKSEVHAYFMFLTQRLMEIVGLDLSKCRFRQHRRDELAHYAVDTWDFEVLLSNGWTELTGIADRGAYDLTAHASKSGQDLSYFKRGTGEMRRRKVVKANRAALGKRFRNEARLIADAVERLQPEVVGGEITVDVEGRKYVLSTDFYEVTEIEEKDSGRRVVPHVIEPSGGLDRIFYAVLEHSLTSSEEGDAFALAPSIAPIKAGVFPLTQADEQCTFAREIYERLLSDSIEVYYDESGSIGRRYARMDEVGTPYCVTVDEISLTDRTVTIRDRRTKQQIRIHADSINAYLQKLINWDAVRETG
ncbi:MAG: glycine--tRNA ligase [Methanomassiliicoccales archaeon]